MMGPSHMGHSAKEGTNVGTLVTLDLPDDSPVLALPWIITFGPADEDADNWEPVVCGPYERAHALAEAALGEQTAGVSVALVRRRLEEELAEG